MRWFPRCWTRVCPIGMATIVTRDNAEDVGRILVEENVRLVLYRYGGRLGDDEKQAAALIMHYKVF